MIILDNFTFFLVILLFSITPGPGVFALISSALTTGIKKCYPLALGMSMGDILYLTLAFYGLVSIAQNYTLIFDTIRIIGALYLLYLGYKIFTSKQSTNIADAKQSYKGFISSVLQGFLISSSNPKVILFYLAFLPTFVDLNTVQTSDIIVMICLTFIALMMGLLLISFSAHKARKIFKSEKATSILNKIAGSIMGIAGISLLANY